MLYRRVKYSSMYQNRNYLFNAQGNVSRIIPSINIFLLQNEHATYKMQHKIPVIFKILLTYGKQTLNKNKTKCSQPSKPKAN